VLVIEENHTFTEVQNGMPWLIAQGNKYGYATNYHADTAGSLMDYLWLSSGSCHSNDYPNCTLPAGTTDFGCTGDACAAPITDDNIFRELGQAGLTWKVYAQSLPSVGYANNSPNPNPDPYPYVARHNPAVFYSDVINSKQLQQNIVPFAQFSADVAANQLPNYSIIIPDLLNDAHDGTVQTADVFLQTNVSPLLSSPYFQAGGDGLVFITFDECDAAVGACPEQVYTAVMGPKVKPKTVSNSYYKHESMLRTILDALGVNVYPGAAATAKDMTDFF
jgi:phosphatidylinositol-3-phosphatase